MILEVLDELVIVAVDRLRRRREDAAKICLLGWPGGSRCAFP